MTTTDVAPKAEQPTASDQATPVGEPPVSEVAAAAKSPAKPEAPATPSASELFEAPGPEAAAPTEPVDYDAIAPPDGHAFADEELTALRGWAKDSNLTAEQAARFLAREHEISQQAAVAAEQARTEQRQEWEAELAKDPDVGGQRLARSVRAVKAWWTKEFGQDVADALHKSGQLYNPALFKPSARLGGSLLEPEGVVPATAPSAKPWNQMTPRERWEVAQPGVPFPGGGD